MQWETFNPSSPFWLIVVSDVVLAVGAFFLINGRHGIAVGCLIGGVALLLIGELLFGDDEPEEDVGAQRDVGRL